MIAAASATTNSFCETEICRCWVDFMPSRAVYIESVKARSLMALGATRATFRVEMAVVDLPAATALALVPIAVAVRASPSPSAPARVFLKTLRMLFLLVDGWLGRSGAGRHMRDGPWLTRPARRACRGRRAGGNDGRRAKGRGW